MLLLAEYFSAPASSAGVERVFSAAGKMHGDLQAAGRWHSDAYLRYLRESRSQGLHNLSLVASADTDDNEADFVDVDARGFDDDDDN